MEQDRSFEKKAVEAAIRIAIVAVLVVWTYQIIRPFLMPVIWGLIIAVAVNPFIETCSNCLGGRRKLVSIFFGVLIIITLVIPVVLLSTSSIQALQPYMKGIHKINITIPPPPSTVKAWPLIGEYVSKFWSLASTNLGAVLKQFEPQLKAAAVYLLGLVGGGVKAVFLFIISIVIASGLLANAHSAACSIRKVICRFAGDKGPEIIQITTSTIRAVMLGVVGVAIIQSILSAIGMLIVGVPLTGLWAALVLVCAVIQLPPFLVLGPVSVWVFYTSETTPAVIFLIWCLIVSASDSVLKPLLMGRGVKIPMLVILIGALGGLMVSGIIGLFIGAVIVAISYELFIAWVEEADESCSKCK